MCHGSAEGWGGGGGTQKPPTRSRKPTFRIVISVTSDTTPDAPTPVTLPDRELDIGRDYAVVRKILWSITQVGVGIAYDSLGEPYYTQEFGAPGSTS